MRLVDAGCDLLEIETVESANGLGRAAGEQRRAEQCSRGGNAERAAHHLPAAIAPRDDIADRLAIRRTERLIVVGFVGLRPVAEAVAFRHMRGLLDERRARA